MTVLPVVLGQPVATWCNQLQPVANTPLSQTHLGREWAPAQLAAGAHRCVDSMAGAWGRRDTRREAARQVPPP